MGQRLMAAVQVSVKRWQLPNAKFRQVGAARQQRSEFTVRDCTVAQQLSPCTLWMQSRKRHSASNLTR